MAYSNFYETGTVTVSAGGTALTGIGTEWVTAGVVPGAAVFVAGHSLPLLVRSVTSETTIVLDLPAPQAATGAAYVMLTLAYDAPMVELLRRLLNQQTKAFDLDGEDKSLTLTTDAGTVETVYATETSGEGRFRFGLIDGDLDTFRVQRWASGAWADVFTVARATGVVTWDGSPAPEAAYLEGLVASAEAAETAAAASAVAADTSASAAATLVGTFSASGLTRDVVGHTDVTATGSTTGNAFVYYWPDTISTTDRWIDTLEIAVTGGGVASVVVATVNGDGSLTLVSAQTVTLVSGANTITGLDIKIPAGCVAGVGGRSGVYFDAGVATTTWSTPSVPTTSTAKTVNASNPIHYRLTLDGEIAHKARKSYALSTAQASAVGDDTTDGWPSISASGSSLPASFTVTLTDRPAPAAGFVTSAKIGAAVAGTVDVMVVTLSGSTVSAITSRQTVAVLVGVNTISLALPIAVGQFVAFTPAASGNIAFQSSANPLGIGVSYKTGSVLAVSDALTASTQHRYEVAATISTGLTGQVGALSHGRGVTPAVGVAGTGGDETAAFVAASAPTATGFVPAGAYAVTALAANGHGLWGPGKVYLNGLRWPLPMRPTSTTALAAVQANLAEHAANGDVLALIGDSISHWAYASTGGKHWFNMLAAWSNYGASPGDEPIMTALRPSLTYDPGFYGVTYTGTVTTGTAGPIGESAILAAGAVMTFTGAYSAIGFWFEQVSGAGTVTVARAGSTIATIACAGSTTHDVFSAEIATGNAASATYTLTVSGGAVEITGLLRLGALATGRKRLRTARFAHGSYTFASFGAAARASIIKQSTYAGGVVVPIIALGINDAFAVDPATTVTNAAALIDALVAGGAPRVFALPPMRPTSAWDASFTSGRTYDAALGALRRLYRQKSVIILPVDGLDMIGLGAQQDGLHPNDGGNDAMFVAVAERLAAAI